MFYKISNVNMISFKTLTSMSLICRMWPTEYEARILDNIKLHINEF